MWTYSHSVESSAPPAAIFARFRDVATWPEWDASLERMELDGPFVAGTTGRMVMRGQAPLATRLAWVELDRGFHDETPVPWAGVVVYVGHDLEPLERGGTRITFAVRIVGPNAAQLGPTIGPQITADFPLTMAALVARVEDAVQRT